MLVTSNSYVNVNKTDLPGVRTFSPEDSSSGDCHITIRVNNNRIFAPELDSKVSILLMGTGMDRYFEGDGC